MGRAAFPVPDDPRETIALLNASRTFNLSIVERPGRVVILDGDQAQYAADTPGEVAAYLAALFLEAYLGRPLETIQCEIAACRFAGMDADEACAELQRARQSPR